MLKVFIVLFIVLNLYSQDLVTIYRNEGINSLQNKINELLKNEDYWKSFLKDKKIDYGYYESKKNILLTNKKKAQITLLNYNNGKLTEIFKESVIIGENRGDKYKEGDKKTPIGAYELIQRKTKLDSFYGPLALVTSYPNTFDKTLNKKGSGIWIHGMPLNENREEFTKGCIALENIELKKLDELIKFKKTILITSENDIEIAKKEEIAKILTMIFNWKDAWKQSSISKYLSFYSKSFKKSDGTNLKNFASYKKRVFAKNERKIIKFKNIDISPYPNSLNKRIFKINMDENYISPTVNFKGTKELFVEFIDGKVKILVED